LVQLLLWSMASDFQTPHKGAVLSNASATAKRGGTYPSSHGGTALAFATGFSATRPKWVLAGQEGGSVVRAQATRLLNAADTGGKTTKTGNKYHSLRRTGETFSHDAHIGPVTSIQCSPFHRSLFLTGGQDGSVRLYHMLETCALQVWEPVPPPDKMDMDLSFAPISCVGFSQTRPAVFAAASRDGFVYIFDLLVSRSGPAAVIEVPAAESWGGGGSGKKSGAGRGGHASSARVRISGLAFNKKQRDLLSVCDDAGRVLVYRLGWSMANKAGPQEQALVDRIGRISADDQ
jgi:WD40 repeat protein